MASNDDNTKNSKEIENGLPAAIFATTGGPELIKKKVQGEMIFCLK
jgi:hypothetical protein